MQKLQCYCDMCGTELAPHPNSPSKFLGLSAVMNLKSTNEDVETTVPIVGKDFCSKSCLTQAVNNTLSNLP